MKKLELNQMENLEGAISQRNCMILGGFIFGGVIAGFFSFGGGWAVASGAAIAAASSDCF